MRISGWVLGLGVAALTTGMAAQENQAAHEPLSAIPPQVILGDSCPVGFHAEVDPRLLMRAAKDGRGKADATVVRLDFEARGTHKKISAARVTAYGVAPAGLLMPVGQAPGAKRTQAFEITPGKADAGLVSTEINVTAVPFVRWVQLNQLTYSDGSVWHATPGLACKSALTGFHLVSAQ